MSITFHDAAAAALLHPSAPIEQIATGTTWAEGPAWVNQEQALYWSDIPASRIMRWHATQGTTVAWADVEFTNGRTVAADGSLITCSHGRRAIERWVIGEAEPTILVDRWGEARLNSPNDVVTDSSGAIWFTDPPYGIVQAHEGHLGDPEYGGCYVFRYQPATQVLGAVILDVEEPNGLAFSPDETILYVADTSAALRTDGTGNRCIRAYDHLQGRCLNGRVFATMTKGLADGFRVDEHGNVWTSHGSGISIIAPDGTWLADIQLPETVGNLTFGGESGTDVFIAASTSIYRMSTTVRGATDRRSRKDHP